MWNKLWTDRKKVLYTLCFVWLVMVDFIRGSQDGARWAAAVNSIGFVMTILIMVQLPWGEKDRRSCVIWSLGWFAGAAVGYAIWRINPGIIYRGQFLTGAVNVWCMGMIALKFWRERELLLPFWKRRRWKVPVLALCWILLSVLMLLSPYGSIWQIWFLFLFGAFYLTPLQEGEGKRLWDGMADGIILGFFCLQIYAYGFRPYDEVRYKGAYSNCNINALFYLVTYVMLLYRIHDFTRKHREHKIRGIAYSWKQRLELLFYYVMAGGLLSFVMFTLTRTALLMAALLTMVYGLLTVLVVYREKLRYLVGRYLLIGLCTVITFPMVYLTIRYLPAILHHPVWYGGEYSIDKVHSFDEADSWKFVSFQEYLEAAFGRLSYGGLLAKITGQDETDQMAGGENSMEMPGTAEEGASGAEEDGAGAGEGETGAGEGETGAGEDASGAREGETGAGEGETGAREGEAGAGEDASGAREGETGAGEDATGAGEGATGTEEDGSGAEKQISGAEDQPDKENYTDPSGPFAEDSRDTGDLAREADSPAEVPQDTEYLLGDEDAMDSGKIRKEIYRLYLENLNMTGHRLTDGFFQITRDYHAWHAQNLFLQAAFFYGIPAGLLNILILSIIGMKSLLLVWRRKDSAGILPFLVWMLFVGYGMLECVWNPGQLILFLVFFVQKIFVQEDRNQEAFKLV